MRKRRASHIAALMVCGVFAVGSFLLDMPWWTGMFWTVGFLALLLVPPGWEAFVDELEIFSSCTAATAKESPSRKTLP